MVFAKLKHPQNQHVRLVARFSTDRGLLFSERREAKSERDVARFSPVRATAAL
jgi:hypothetical protein